MLNFPHQGWVGSRGTVSLTYTKETPEYPGWFLNFKLDEYIYTLVQKALCLFWVRLGKLSCALQRSQVVFSVFVPPLIGATTL